MLSSKLDEATFSTSIQTLTSRLGFPVDQCVTVLRIAGIASAMSCHLTRAAGLDPRSFIPISQEANLS